MKSRDARGTGRYSRFFTWLDDKLIPAIGPADVGPYAAGSPSASDACPVCGHPMGEHTIDRSRPNTLLVCPERPLPVAEDAEPVNEMGIPTDSARRRAARHDARA